MSPILPLLVAGFGLFFLLSQLQAGGALLLVTLNAASLTAYALDKSRAESGGSRIPERVLHTLSVTGGAGACFGRWLFRHKTKHFSFLISSWVGAALLWFLALHGSLYRS